MKHSLILSTLAAALAFGALAHGAEPKVRVLSVAEDATQKTVLVGRTLVDNMIVMFELEPAKAMWMQMGGAGKWMEHGVGPNERFHVEVKPIDPASKTRISHAEIKFEATNKSNGKKLSADLHPMWGGSGLHYAMNSALAGDGSYEAQITVGIPAVARAPQDKDMWRTSATASFHFKFKEGKLVEVSEPEVGG